MCRGPTEFSVQTNTIIMNSQGQNLWKTYFYSLTQTWICCISFHRPCPKAAFFDLKSIITFLSHFKFHTWGNKRNGKSIFRHFNWKNLLSIFSCILHNGSFHRVITGLDENESSCLKLGSSFGFENMNGCCNTYTYIIPTYWGGLWSTFQGNNLIPITLL